MDLNLANKTVIVTGGASNIGRGIVLAFAKEKSNIIIAEIDEPQANKTAKVAKSLGGNPRVVMCDVTNWDSVQAMVKKTLAEFKTIDVLVNNVGFVEHHPFVEKPREQWDREIKLNYVGFLNCTRSVLDHMIDRKYGNIVSISSDSGRMGENREVVYAGTKGAVIAASKAIAREVGRFGIRVNVICPAATMAEDREEWIGEKSMQHAGTRPEAGVQRAPDPQRDRIRRILYPLRRGETMGKPEDIANAAVFLASDAASWITGQTLSVDGGYTMA